MKDSMQETIEKLVDCLCEKHGLFREEAYSIVYGEWEYIEEMVETGTSDRKLCKKIAKELLEMYMVA